MNNDMNVNHLIRRLKGTRVPEVDLTSKVMQKIYSFHGKYRVDMLPRRAFRISPVWIAACVLLFIVTASVSAATLFQTTWNGVQVSIGDNVKDTTTPADKNEPSSKKRLETALSGSTDVWQKISLDEAKRKFPFTLLRPEDSEFTLVTSFGVVPKDPNYRVKSADEWWLGGFHDILQWNQHDIVVSQNLDVEMTQALQNPMETMAMTFNQATWENIGVADDTLAMFTANGTENLMILKYKTADRKVISIELKGDIEKENFAKLAKAYVGQ